METELPPGSCNSTGHLSTIGWHMPGIVSYKILLSLNDFSEFASFWFIIFLMPQFPFHVLYRLNECLKNLSFYREFQKEQNFFITNTLHYRK